MMVSFLDRINPLSWFCRWPRESSRDSSNDGLLNGSEVSRFERLLDSFEDGFLDGIYDCMLDGSKDRKKCYSAWCKSAFNDWAKLKLNDSSILGSDERFDGSSVDGLHGISRNS